VRSLSAAVLRPSVWLALGVLATPLSSSSSPTSGAAITASDLLLGVAIVLAAVALTRGRGTRMVGTVPAAGFALLGVVSLGIAAVARDFPTSLVGGIRFVELFFLVPVAVMVALRTRTEVGIFLGGLVGLAVVEGAIGIVQAATGTGADIGGATIRAVGTFGAYNIAALADLTAIAFVICLALGTVLPKAARWWALGTAVFLAVPLALSLSRGTWLAAAAAAVLVLSRGRPLRLLMTVAVVAVVAALTLPVLAGGSSDLSLRVASVLDAGSEPDQSVIDRQALWHAATEMALDHPLTGVGPRAFPEHRDAYADLSLLGSSDIAIGSSFQRVSLDSPHDFYLLVAGELGLVAAAVFVLVFLVLLARGVVRAARRRSDASTALALAGAGLLAYELVSFVSADLGGPGSIYVAVALGLAGWAAADVDLLPDRPRPEPARGAPVDEPSREPVTTGSAS
jgi:hypothetical protein